MRTADPQLRERRRTQIVEAAARCFVAKGFHQTSMAEIAVASGLSMGLLYRYFRSKDEIVLAAAQRERAASVEAAAALRDAATLREGVSAYVRAAVEMAFDGDYMRIVTEVLAECGRNPALLAQLRAEDAIAMQALEAALAGLQERGLVAAQTPVGQLAALFAASLEGVATRALLDESLDRATLEGALVVHWVGALAPPRPSRRSASARRADV